MSRDCRAEECPMWDGDTCPCETFGLDPDDLPRDGTFTTDHRRRGKAQRGDGAHTMTVTVDLAQITSPQRRLLEGWLRENGVRDHVALEPITVHDDRIHYTAIRDDRLYGVPASAPLTVPLPERLRDLAVEDEP